MRGIECGAEENNEESGPGGPRSLAPSAGPEEATEGRVSASAGGTVRVEIQDEAGEPHEGFTAAEADEINGNYVRVPVTWDGNGDVGPLAGKPIRLRFVMRDAKLYSFQFLPARAGPES